MPSSEPILNILQAENITNENPKFKFSKYRKSGEINKKGLYQILDLHGNIFDWVQPNENPKRQIALNLFKIAAKKTSKYRKSRGELIWCQRLSID